MTRIQKLLAFAAETLTTLEAHEDWDGDTTSEIGDSAIRLGLAFNDDLSYFRADPEALAAVTIAQVNNAS